MRESRILFALLFVSLCCNYVVFSVSVEKGEEKNLLLRRRVGLELDSSLENLLDKAKEYGRISAINAETAKNFSKLQNKYKYDFQRDSEAYQEVTKKAIYEAKRAYEESLHAAEIARINGEEDEAREIKENAEKRFSAARAKVLNSLYEMQSRAVEVESNAARAKAKIMKNVAKSVEKAAKSNKDAEEKVEKKKRDSKKAEEALEYYKKQHERDLMVHSLMKKSAFALDASDAKRLSRAHDFTWGSYFRTLE